MPSSTDEELAVRELMFLCLSSILRPCSHVGTAQWQYLLPNRSKSKVLDPKSAFYNKAFEIADDVKFATQNGWGKDISVLDHDARERSDLAPNSVDMVITSPPYPNNFDYADATRLEMTFWGEIDGWADLQNKVRKNIVRSCSQHSAAERLKLEQVLSEPALVPILPELSKVCEELALVRLTKGGKKTYHTMIAAYYLDMAVILKNLRPVCKPGSELHFVIGDSAPYGVHAPAVEWLGRLAEAAGFDQVGFEKIRDRNIKWKNRKHTVPLVEGRLTFKG